MIFCNGVQTIPWEYHNYNDGLPFNYRHYYVTEGLGNGVNKIWCPVNQDRGIGSIYMRMRKDNMASSYWAFGIYTSDGWLCSNGLACRGDNEIYYSDPNPPHCDHVDSQYYHYDYDSTYKMHGLRNNYDMHDFRGDCVVRPFAVLYIHGNVVPAHWNGHVCTPHSDLSWPTTIDSIKIGDETTWIGDGDIFDIQIKKYADTTVAGQKWHPCLVLSPVFYEYGESSYSAGIGECFLPMPTLSFKNMQIGDEIILMEYGCEYLSD